MRKLLLADDSITIQRVIELTFASENVQVVAVGDGEEAIARIPAERPDIVLADIGMPKRSGYEVAAFVKGNPDLAHIPVLLLAGAFEPIDQARADQVRCDGVLVKPFEPQQVIARVRALMNGAKGGAAGAPRAPAEASRPRIIDAPPAVEIPDPRDAAPPPGSDSDGSLDDYFDRLDAAFASLGSGAAPPVPPRVLDDAADRPRVPTLDDLLGSPPAGTVPGDPPPFGRMAGPPLEPPDSAPTITPAPPAAVDAAPAHETSPAAPGEGPLPEGGRNVIADVFSALLAVEQGESGTPALLARPRIPSPVTDDLVDEVTRRVLERLAPGAAKELVAQIVSDVAERLVREEIARIRGTS